MKPVITLTTDFGDAGPYVGVMKSVILRFAPDATIVDLNHHVSPFRPAEAGFWLSRSFTHFAQGSVHVAVVDPGVGTSRAVLACTSGGQAFVAPDNGILPMVAAADTRFYALGEDWPGRRAWPAPGHTFHGRDIFAPLAATLLVGKARPADIGPEVAQPVAPEIPAAVRLADAVAGSVVAVDSWGNLITNIGAELIGDLSKPLVCIGRQNLSLVTTYGSVPRATPLALINSLGTVEVAVREGNAAQMLGFSYGTRVTVTTG